MSLIEDWVAILELPTRMALSTRPDLEQTTQQEIAHGQSLQTFSCVGWLSQP